MDIDNLTYKEILKLLSLFGNKNNSDPISDPIMEVGKSYFIRTVTHHYTGKCEKITEKWCELSSAAWIADDGRFNEFLKTGIASEVEPYVKNVRLSLGSIIDVSEWGHPLPSEVK